MANHLPCSLQAQSQQDNILHGPVAILWDIEYCPVPIDVQADSVAGNIRKALRTHPVIKGAVTLFSAYGDFNVFSRRLREGCQRTGVKLVDVPSGRKFATDKAILVDMFLFALDNRPPASILLISGDADFSPALHVLGQRGYTVVVVVPAFFHVESALSSAGAFVWDWPTVARGEGFVPLTVVPHECERAGYHINCQLGDQKNGQNEEMLVYRKIPGSEFSIPAEMGPAYLHKHARTSVEFEGAQFSSKCKTPQGLQSNPMEGSKFSGNRWGEQSLEVQSLDIDNRYTKKLKMKQKEFSAPAKVNTIFRYRYDPVSKEVNGTPYSLAECNDCNKVLSNPNSSDVPPVGWNGLKDHALPMQPLDVDKNLGKNMNKKQKKVGTLADAAPAKVNTIFRYRYDPVSKEVNGTPYSLAECNDCNKVLSNPNSSDVPPVGWNGLKEHALPMQPLDVDKNLGKNMNKKQKKVGTLAKIDPICKFSGSPHPLPECNNPRTLPPEPSEVLLVENDSTQAKLLVQSTNVDGTHAKKSRRKKKQFIEIPYLLSECDNPHDYPQCLPSEQSEVPPDENALTQVKLLVQSHSVDGRRTKKRRRLKKAMKQNEYNEPASPVFPFKYCQVAVEPNDTRNTLDYDSLQSRPSDLSEILLVHQNASEEHKLWEQSLNINEDQVKAGHEDQMK